MASEGNFTGQDSTTREPRPWGCDATIVRNGGAPVEESSHLRRAFVTECGLSAESEGIATVEPPQSGSVVVTAAGGYFGLRLDPRKFQSAYD